MKDGRTSISKAKTYKEMGEYWDTHSLSDVWDRTREVDMEVDIKSNKFYFSLDSELSRKLFEIARNRGVSTTTLLNLWVQEKVSEGRLRKQKIGSRPIPMKNLKKRGKEMKRKAANPSSH